MAEEEKICPLLTAGFSTGSTSIQLVECLGKRCKLYTVIEDSDDQGGHFHWEGCGLVKPEGC